MRTTLAIPTDDLDTLPLWPRVLIAARAAERAVRTVAIEYPGGAPAWMGVALASCDAVARTATIGSRRVGAALDEPRLTGAGPQTDREHQAAHAAFFAVDAMLAAMERGESPRSSAACTDATRAAIRHAAQAAGTSVEIAARFDTVLLGAAKRFGCLLDDDAVPATLLPPVTASMQSLFRAGA